MPKVQAQGTRVLLPLRVGLDLEGVHQPGTAGGVGPADPLVHPHLRLPELPRPLQHDGLLPAKGGGRRDGRGGLLGQ